MSVWISTEFDRYLAVESRAMPGVLRASALGYQRRDDLGTFFRHGIELLGFPPTWGDPVELVEFLDSLHSQ